MANQTQTGISPWGLSMSNLRHVSVAVDAAGIGIGETLTVVLPADLDSNYLPLQAPTVWRGAVGTWAPLAAGALVITSYVPATRTLVLTAAAALNSLDEVFILLGATENAIA